jgi:hypothetical protein
MAVGCFLAIDRFKSHSVLIPLGFLAPIMEYFEGKYKSSGVMASPFLGHFE